MTCGIYSITSPSGNCYVGSSVRCKRRWSAHRYHLKRGNHHSAGLQRAYRKYEGALEYKILIVCEPKDLLLYEQIAMDGLKPRYNMGIFAVSRKGVAHTEAAKEKNRNAHLGNRASPHTRETLSRLLIGSRRLAGRSLTEEHKAAISKSVKGKPHRDNLRVRLGTSGLESLKKDYASGLGLTVLQQKYGAWHKTISNLLRSEGVQIRKRGSPLLPMNGS